jgi:hypothetical protein
MAKPVNNFEFATDTNYATGPDSGTPTKVAPSSGEIDSGFVRGTAAVAQHTNYLFGEIEDWLGYVAGMASDSEFLADLLASLEAESWVFSQPVTVTTDLNVNDDLGVGDKLTVAGTSELGGLVTAQSNLHVLGSLDVDTGLVSGALTLGSTLTMPSRTVTRSIPLTFSPGYFNNAGVFQPQGYLNKQGLHFWGDDLGGGYFRPNMSFTVPRGATLTQVVLVGAKAAAASTDPSVELFLAVGNSVDNTTTSKGSTTLTSTTGSQKTINVSSPVVSDQFTQYVIELVPSQTSGSGDTDRISWIDISYTTTHADENV